MKSYFYRFIFKIWEVPQRFRLRSIKTSKLYVIDIDNTLTVYRGDGKIDHINPTARINLVQFVRSILMKNQKVIYLSARDFRLLNHTVLWLSKNGILSSKNDVFLVPSAYAKLAYLKILIANNKSIDYIDDLSYNHENGQVKFYSEIISQIQKLPLRYKGVEFIESI